MIEFGGENVTLYNQSSDAKECQYNFSDISVLKEETWTPELELSWPCELREYWQEMLPVHSAASHLLNYGTTVIVCTGLLLNLLIIRTLRTRMMSSGTTVMYLVALAIYDSCVLLFNFSIGVLRAQNPQTINRLFKEQEWLCLTHSVVVELFNLLSVWMIVCFTIERFIAVYFPLRVSELCSPKRTKLIITMVTAAIFLFAMHKIFISGFEGDSVFGYKGCRTSRIQTAHVIYLDVAFNTWLPAVVVIALNGTIIKTVCRQAKIQRRMSWRSQQRNNSHHEFRLTRTLLAISAVYLMLLLPLGTVQTTELWLRSVSQVAPSTDRNKQMEYIRVTQTSMLLKWIRMFCFFFYQFNFAINFFVYVITNIKFRKAFIASLPCALASHRWPRASTASTSIVNAPTTNSKDQTDTDLSTPPPKKIFTISKSPARP